MVSFTARSATFINGETEVIVPFTIVPVGGLLVSTVAEGVKNLGVWVGNCIGSTRTVLELDCDGLILAFHEESTRNN